MNYHQSSKKINQVFQHYNTKVNNVNIHYVKGGKGEPLVLLHGYPQTWYAFRYIMPILAKYYTVIVPDLRGLGDSEKPESGYDTATIAEDIFQLISGLGYVSVRLLGHDFGANVAYAFAALHRNSVLKLALLDVGIFLNSTLVDSPLVPRQGKSLWWFPFQMTAELPEVLVEGREAAYISWFFKSSTYIKDAIGSKDLEEYVRCYSSPGGMRAGFNYYRRLLDDVDFNEEQIKIKLKIPVIAVGGEYSFGSKVYESWKHAAECIKGEIIPNSGHYIAEEQPELLLNILIPFFE